MKSPNTHRGRTVSSRRPEVPLGKPQVLPKLFFLSPIKGQLALKIWMWDYRMSPGLSIKPLLSNNVINPFVALCTFFT